jgi:hypothetical protein
VISGMLSLAVEAIMFLPLAAGGAHDGGLAGVSWLLHWPGLLVASLFVRSPDAATWKSMTAMFIGQWLVVWVVFTWFFRRALGAGSTAGGLE